MNLKYYLRGLGIGIIVTAILMGIAAGNKKPALSSEEIKERARALGMVEESTVLADTEQVPAPQADTTPSAAPTKTPMPTPSESPMETPSAAPLPERTSEPASVSTPGETSKPSAAPTTMPAATPTAMPMPTAAPTEKPADGDGGAQNSETVSVTVSSGDGSLTVSRKLEQAGLVSSAADFDRYLCQNGYDKRLNVGTYTIPADAAPEQIARILVGLE